MKSLPTLYKRTATGATQQWSIEIDANKFRVTSGQVGGQLTINQWTTCLPKNIGRANATTDNEQAVAEAQAKWDKKATIGYTTDPNKVDTCYTYTKPMLAEKFKKFKHQYPVYTQPKLDGMRCICREDGMWSRTGKPIVSAPHIHAALKPLFDADPSLIFDGELFADKYKDDFNAIISLAKQTKPTSEDLAKSEAALQYWVYDLPSSEENFSKRFAELEKIIPKNKYLVIVKTDLIKNQEELDERYAEYLSDGQEGQIIRLDAPYENKRTTSLIKRKEFIDGEFKIVDITEGKGNRAGMFGRARCVTNAEVEFEANARGNRAYYTELLKNRKKYIGKMATIRYQNMTPDGKPRFGVLVAIRDYE